MAQAHIQSSFNSGEWSPTLFARVDLQKYRSGAALLQNWFVDYRGGASTRSGTQYILQAYKSSTAVRLITFQATFDLAYILELGDFYMRFYNNGSPVLEDSFAITDADQTDPLVIEVVGNDFAAGDWVFITGVGGMTEINGKYFEVLSVATDDVTLGRILDGADIDATGYSAYTSGGTAARVYTIATPWAADDLALLKFQIDVNAMRFVHPDYSPYILTLVEANEWTLLPITFGATVDIPTGVSIATTLSAGNVHYSYTVTAVDSDGQESPAATAGALASRTDLRTTAGTNTITWNSVAGAQSYNVYKSEVSYAGAIPAGAAYGYIGNAVGVSFADSNIAPDFSATPPIAKNPFQGAGVQSITITNPGTYTTVPTATLTAAPAGGTSATIQPVLQVITAVPTTPGTGGGFGIGDLIFPATATGFGSVILRVTATNGSSQVTAVSIVSAGSISSGNTPASPMNFKKPNDAGLVSITLTWGVGTVVVTNGGSGYLVAPTVTFSAGSAAATAVLAPAAAGNPAAIGVFQQRQVYGGPSGAPLQFNMSRPGSPNNFNISNPIRADDAIQGQLVSQVLNSIKAFVQVPSGLITLTDRAAWLLNAGSSNEAVTQPNITANAHSYNGISDVPPIVANYDILYVQSKGSTVRNLSYNFYANVFTGTDITIQSSHLFNGYTVDEWAWAEEPFKVAWCVRNDGTLLSLTFLKEQEFIAWAHSETEGLFKSVTAATEASMDSGTVDSIYLCIEREVDSVTVQYIERMVERIFPNGVEDAWCVDAGLNYEGPPEDEFTGGEHLAGMTVTGLADGEVIEPFVMPVDGNFTLPAPAEKVVIGLGFECDLQTLALDLGEPTVQGKVKQIPFVDIRVAETLGLKIGATFAKMFPMKDLIIGNVSSMLVGMPSQRITGLVTGDARQRLDASYTIMGQYCIRQSQPLPATVLGVIPQVEIGDTGGRDGRRSA